MAVNKYITHLNHTNATIKVISDASTGGSATIGLTTDLLKSNESLSGETVMVNLGPVESSCETNKEIVLTRNGAIVMNLSENSDYFALEFGSDPHNNTHDLVVNFTGKGTVYIRLFKLKGYRPNFRPEQGVNL